MLRIPTALGIASALRPAAKGVVMAGLLLPAWGTPLPAQSVQTIDQGSFTISVNNQRVGREDFRITTSPNGGARDYDATATVTYGERRLSPALHADTTGTPSFYSVVVRNAGQPQEQWTGNIVRGRVSAKIRSARGESAKEFIVTDGALILDDDVFHQYYFIARRAASGDSISVSRRAHPHDGY